MRIIKKYSELEVKRFLLEWRINHAGNELERYLVYYQLGCENQLMQEQRDYLWNKVNLFIGKTTKEKFKQAQKKVNHPYYAEYHMERVILFYELAKNFHDPVRYPPKMLCSQYQTRFYEYEAFLQFKRLGIQITDSDGNPVPITSITSSTVIRKFIMYFHMRRQNMTFEEYYVRKFGEYPSRKAILKWYAWELYMQDVINRSGGLVSYQLFQFSNSCSYNDDLSKNASNAL